MSPIACACNKRNRATASGTPAPSGTYRVMVNGRQSYETSNPDAAKKVGERFQDAEVHTPDNKILKLVSGSWVQQ